MVAGVCLGKPPATVDAKPRTNPVALRQAGNDGSGRRQRDGILHPAARPAGRERWPRNRSGRAGEDAQLTRHASQARRAFRPDQAGAVLVRLARAGRNDRPDRLRAGFRGAPRNARCPASDEGGLCVAEAGGLPPDRRTEGTCHLNSLQ